MAPTAENNPRKDQAMAAYVDALQTGVALAKDEDMEIRQLQSLADRLHQLTNTYPAASASSTRKRMEIFNAYRQAVRNKPASENANWFDRLFKDSGVPSRTLAAAFMAVLLLVTIGIGLYNPAGSDLAGTAGLGSWLVPGIAFGFLLAAAAIYYFRQRK